MANYIYIYIYTAAQKFGISKICNVPSAHQGCIYLIKNTEEKKNREILLQFKITAFYFNIV